MVVINDRSRGSSVEARKVKSCISYISGRQSKPFMRIRIAQMEPCQPCQKNNAQQIESLLNEAACLYGLIPGTPAVLVRYSVQAYSGGTDGLLAYFMFDAKIHVVIDFVLLRWYASNSNRRSILLIPPSSLAYLFCELCMF